jgi:hypothetical protein
MRRQPPEGPHRASDRATPRAGEPVQRLYVDGRGAHKAQDARDGASGGRVDRRSKRDGSIARGKSLANVSAPLIRKSTYEPQRRPFRVQSLGSLDDEPLLIAKRLQQLACTAKIVVWLNEARIFAAPADSAAKVPPAALIGLYGSGVLLVEIERDLAASRSRGS